MRVLRLVPAALAALAALVLASGAAATTVGEAVSTFTYTQNMHPLGFSERAVPTDNTVAGSGVFNSDLAFWGDRAIQGTYEGFRIIDISSPANPVELVNYTGCSPGTTVGNQGDILVWDNLLIRSWNSPVSAANAATASCGGELVGRYALCRPEAQARPGWVNRGWSASVLLRISRRGRPCGLAGHAT